MSGTRRGISSSSASDCGASTKIRINAEFGKYPASLDSVVKTMHAARISARDNAKVRVGTTGERSFQFLFHFSKRDDLFAVEMTAAFGRDLIFDMNGRRASAFELSNRANEIDGIAITGVSISDHGYPHG